MYKKTKISTFLDILTIKQNQKEAKATSYIARTRTQTDILMENLVTTRLSLYVAREH